MRVIDLFCGAGGFSLGAYRAGFEVVASIDVDKTLTQSYKSNFPRTSLLIADISRIDPEQLISVVGTGEVDGIIGGPPCQGFSTIGKRRPRDPRNRLVRHFFRMVGALRPRFFVMENVPGMLTGRGKRTLQSAAATLKDYSLVGPLLVDAHDLGAPTHRRRVLLIGFDPRRMQSITEADIRSLECAPRVTVRDAIFDLPVPRVGATGRYPKGRRVSEYAMTMRTAPQDGLGSSSARERLAKNSVAGVQRTLHTPSTIKRFRKVPQGKTDRISRCVRLRWDSASPTLRAGTGPDRGSFQAVRPLHPSQPRVITVREAARLQGFPDWFEFHATKWHSFRMVGNSVSPIMAEKIMSLIGSKIAAAQ